MPLIEWSDDLSVNIKEIDEQHKQLLEMVNEFDKAIEGGKEEEIINKTLDSLVDFVSDHFKKEEELLEKYKFPGFEDHRDQHNRFIEDLFSIYKRFKEGEKDVPTRVAFFFGDLLIKHLLEEDKKYGEYLKSKGVT